MNLFAIGKRLLALLLCLIIICSSFVWSVSAESADSVDFVMQSVYPSELIAQLYEISKAEAAFLDGEMNSDIRMHFTVSYDAFSLTDAVICEVDGTTASIFATELEADGLLWTPIGATLLCGDKIYEAALDGDGKAKVQISPADGDKYITVSVEYEAKITYPERIISAAANSAYNAGKAAIEALAKYESDVLLYDQRLNAYKKYQEGLKVYEAELRQYNAYLDTLAQYEADLAEYSEYLVRLDQYGKKLEAYEAYLLEYASYASEYEAYLDFLKNPQKYEEMYKKYLEYCDARALMEAQIAYPDSAFVQDSVGHILYETLHGDTVATVVKNQDALVSTGCNAGDIANADRATKELTAWLDAYPRRGNVDERYEYYIKNYAKLRDSVTLLYSSLAKLYTNDAVPSILEAKDRLERYWQFVSQLYVLHCALDDTAVFNPNWTIAGVYPSELLESCYMLSDGNFATPMAKIPDVVDEATDPLKMHKPTPPKEVQKPTLPIEVDEPTKPQEVAKPVYPTAVEHPGKTPVAPVFSGAIEALMSEVECGSLAFRDISGEQTLAVKQTVSIAVGLDGYAALGFYERGLSQPSDVVALPIGEKVSLPLPTDSEFSDEERVYTFDVWTLDGESALDGTVAHDNARIVAAYRAQIRKYAISWNTGDGTVTTYHAYGTLPTFNDIVALPDSAEYSYSFLAWSPAPSTVIKDAEYTAVFTQTKNSYTVSWEVGDTVISEEYEYGQIPNFDREDLILAHAEYLREQSDGLYRYVFDGWDTAISAVVGNVTYKAKFTSVELIPDVDDTVTVGIELSDSTLTLILKAANGRLDTTLNIAALTSLLKSRALTVKLDGASLYLSKKEAQKLSGGSLLRICADGSQIFFDVLDADGKSVSTDACAQAVLDGYRGATRVYCDGQLCDLTSSEGELAFVLSLGKQYKLLYGAYVTVTDSEGGDCILDGDGFVAVGDTAFVSVLSRPGYIAVGFDVMLADGSKIPYELIDGKYVFQMPTEDVYVSAHFERIQYTVVFVADGKVISESKYYYGDTVVIPTDPTKDTDGEYTYAFVGWDSPVRRVDSDAVYTAVFLPSPVIGEDSVPVSKLGLLEMALIASASALVCGGGLLTAFFLVRKRKRRGM